MYIIGHCFVTARSGRFSEEEIYDDGLLMLMLPDYVNCHDWAYSNAWRANGRDMQLVQAHMLGDWFIHFGDRWASDRRKVGWAYRSMRPACQTYKNFHKEAAALGLRHHYDQMDS